MKSFNNFISEKRSDLPGGNPTNIPPGDIEAIKRQAAGGPREPLSTDVPERRTIRKRIIKTPEGNIETNISPGSRRTPEEQIARAERGRTQNVAGDVRANPKASPEARRAASNLLGGVPDTEPRVGTGARPGTGASYRANQPPKVLGDKIDKLVKSVQQNASTAQRMGAAYARNLEARAGDIIKGLGDERRAETAAGNREFRQLRYGRGRSGPATTLRTPSQSSKWLEGIKKGYFDPKTGKPTASGIQRHINMRAVGGMDFGKFKASGGDPRAALAGVQDAVTRAAAGDRAARSQVKKSYKSLTTNYRPPAVIRNTPAPTAVKQSEVSKQAAAFRQAAKPTPTPSTPAAPSGGGSTASPTLTPTKTKQTLKLAVGSPPKPSVITPQTTKPSPKLNLDKYKVKPLDPIKPVIATSSNYKPITTAAEKSLTSDKIARAVVDASKQVRADIATEKAAEKAKLMKGLSTAGKVLGVVQTGIEAKKGYDIARAMGSSQKRSVGAGAARALGSGLGGVVGGTLGAVAGPIGSAAGAAAGLTVGAQLGSRVYDAVTGAPGKKVTTQGVLTNIRKAVPQEIRAQVPQNVRKGFTDFVKSAGRTYGNWQRSQQGENK